eukprot:79115-Alexandrium_andersonii.AAC.1
MAHAERDTRTRAFANRKHDGAGGRLRGPGRPSRCGWTAGLSSARARLQCGSRGVRALMRVLGRRRRGDTPPLREIYAVASGGCGR